jgi:5-formyltetrahydrofolate cyclo-ligase
MDKMEIRRLMKMQRSDLTDEQVEHASSRVADEVVGLITRWQPRSVHLYRSNVTWKEIDTTGLAVRIRSGFAEIELTIGDARRDAHFPKAQYNMILVPLLAFDDDMARIGHGGGWYDRMLAHQPKALKVGLAYDFQRVQDARAEPHDIALDIIVTPSGPTRRA